MTVAVMVVALGWVTSACGISADDPFDEAPIDPAAAVAASEVPPTDVVGSTSSESAEDTEDTEDSEEELEDTNPLDIRGEILNEYHLSVGECFNRVEALQAGRRLTITARVDCAEPHFAQVYYFFEIDAPHPAIYPGDEAMRDFALQSCYAQFEAFVGSSYELSIYEIGVFTPNRTNFEHATARYRGVHCWLYHVHEDPLSGDAKATAF